MKRKCTTCGREIPKDVQGSEFCSLPCAMYVKKQSTPAKSTKICVDCNAQKELLEFHIDNSRSDLHKSYCKSCASIRNKKYWSEHSTELASVNRSRVRKWEMDNKDKRNAYLREKRKHQSDSGKNNRESRNRLKHRVIKAYGGRCACCGETRMDFLCLDHVNGGGNKHRKSMTNGGGSMYRFVEKSGYPDTYRILCFNCNWSAHLHDGICIHRLENDMRK